jgi:hypothetical protein
MLQVMNLFAAAQPYLGDLPEAVPPKLFGMRFRDAFLLIGAVLLLASILFIWVYAARRSRRALASANPRAIVRAERHEPDEDGRIKYRKKRRRRVHPDNLPRNPSLAETGGLPPIREESIEPTQ